MQERQFEWHEESLMLMTLDMGSGTRRSKQQCKQNHRSKHNGEMLQNCFKYIDSQPIFCRGNIDLLK